MRRPKKWYRLDANQPLDNKLQVASALGSSCRKSMILSINSGGRFCGLTWRLQIEHKHCVAINTYMSACHSSTEPTVIKSIIRRRHTRGRSLVRNFIGPQRLLISDSDNHIISGIHTFNKRTQHARIPGVRCPIPFSECFTIKKMKNIFFSAPSQSFSVFSYPSFGGGQIPHSYSLSPFFWVKFCFA